MKVSFLGAGAIGSMFAALLKHYAPDLDVLVVVRGAHGQAISESGEIRTLGPWGTRSVPIAWSFDPADVAGSDFVFVTVKSQGTAEALQQAGDAIGDAVVVSIQNGINDQAYANHVAPERLVMGMTTTNMAVREPGTVSMQLDGCTLFGPPIGLNSIAAAEKVVELLNRIHVPGLEFLPHSNILGIRYNKLTINALGYASCLSASNFMTEALFHRPWRRVVGRAIVDECKRVYSAVGIQIARIPGRSDLSRLENLMLALELPILDKVVQLGLRGKFERSPIVFSLYQDLERGKPTEVEHINGQVVRLAESAGIHAPVNREIVSMTHELEQQAAATFYARQDVIDRISKLTAS
ncbi:2-dehydropantoate 2-reductase [Aeoliella mucimassa]|uniref:2-dehydropantoate 2-reductase n=2 Tax=Aeoliella mucimassa TaxID=2527972 RepID=A0A518ASP7_9BACT|nr:2-dehydropantoate 2-reductase [Aeoliella mucimassa]